MIAQNRLVLFEVIVLPSIGVKPYLAPVLSLRMFLLSSFQLADAFFEDSACTFKLPNCKKIQAVMRSA